MLIYLFLLGFLDAAKVINEEREELILGTDAKLREKVSLVNHNRAGCDFKHTSNRLGRMPTKEQLTNFTLSPGEDRLAEIGKAIGQALMHVIGATSIAGA